MFCPKCRNELRDEAQFCNNCGEVIGIEEEKPKKKIGNKKIGILLLILLLVCGGVLIPKSGSEKKEPYTIDISADGLLPYVQDDKSGFIDTEGKEVIACKYDYAAFFSEGLAVIEKDEKCGFVDTKGNEVIACKYDYAAFFSEGLAKVKKDEKWGFVDKKGREVIECKYEWIIGGGMRLDMDNPFIVVSDYYGAVDFDGTSYWFDKKGNVIKEFDDENGLLTS